MAEQLYTPLTFYGRFRADGVAVQPSPAPTVTVYAPDGSALVTAVAPVWESTPRRYRYTLSSTNVATEGIYEARFFTTDPGVDDTALYTGWEVGTGGIEFLVAGWGALLPGYYYPVLFRDGVAQVPWRQSEIIVQPEEQWRFVPWRTQWLRAQEGVMLVIEDPKYVAEQRDYGIDWTADLNGATIATSVWTVPGGITQVGGATLSGARTAIRLGGGMTGQEYILRNTVTLSNAEIKVQEFRLRVI